MSNPVVRITPYNNEPGYLCLPLAKNIPNPRNHNWRMVRCPNCGAECWLSLQTKITIKQSGGKLQGVCTECALRAGMVNGPGMKTGALKEEEKICKPKPN